MKLAFLFFMITGLAFTMSPSITDSDDLEFDTDEMSYETTNTDDNSPFDAQSQRMDRLNEEGDYFTTEESYSEDYAEDDLDRTEYSE